MAKATRTAEKASKRQKPAKKPARLITADELDGVYGGIAVRAAGTKDSQR